MSEFDLGGQLPQLNFALQWSAQRDPDRWLPIPLGSGGLGLMGHQLWGKTASIISPFHLVNNALKGIYVNF